MPAIVTLIDLSQRPLELISRLYRLAKVIEDSEFNLFIAHADRFSFADKILKLTFSIFSRVQLYSVRPEGSEVELARLRNAVISKIDADVLLLIDVDIFPDLQLFRSLIASVKAGNRLAIAPCIYLDSAGNRLVKAGHAEKVINDTLRFVPTFALHWAIPSSVTAFLSEDFRAIGGFYEGYRGHGYEDFDFLLRLSIYVGLIKPSIELSIDKTYRAPLLACGFRAALGKLCIPNLLDGNIAFHLFHGKSIDSSYQRLRVTNAEIFRKRATTFINESQPRNPTDQPPDLIFTFYAECFKRNIDPSRFYALFDARPRFFLKSKNVWIRIWRSIRKGLR